MNNKYWVLKGETPISCRESDVYGGFSSWNKDGAIQHAQETTSHAFVVVYEAPNIQQAMAAYEQDLVEYKRGWGFLHSVFVKFPTPVISLSGLGEHFSPSPLYCLPQGMVLTLDVGQNPGREQGESYDQGRIQSRT